MLSPVKNNQSRLIVVTRMADDADAGRGGGCRGAFLAPLFLRIWKPTAIPDCRWGFNPRDAQPPFANFKPPAAEEEIPASAFQFVRKDGSGFGRNYSRSLT
jgi:hypothetical protein